MVRKQTVSSSKDLEMLVSMEAPLAPASGRRRRRHLDRRAEMLDAAMEIALEDGIDALTIAKLAKRMDCAVGALYRYFSDKDELMRALQTRAVSALIETVMTNADAMHARAFSGAGEHAHAIGRVLSLARAYLAHAASAPARHGLIVALQSDPRPLLEEEAALAVTSVFLPLLEACGAALEGATQGGALTPGDVRARTHVLWAGLAGLDLMRKRDRLNPVQLQSPALADEMLTALLCGWGADADVVSGAFLALG